jgi:hypothetical protein
VRYAYELMEDGYKEILIYAAVFEGKECLLCHLRLALLEVSLPLHKKQM